MKLTAILSKLSTLSITGETEKEITGINIDSRKIQPGHIFVAMKGTQVDGHQFIPKAIELGATAVILEDMPDTIADGVTYIKVQSCETAVAQAADDKWEKALSSIEIEPMDSKQEKIFYTSLYHTMMAPQLCSDAGQEPRYTILSLWDTYRAENPMLTLIAPQLSRDLADTYMDIYRKRGQLPVWDLDGWETYCMVGNPGVISLADLVLKGFVEDEQAAYEALVASSRLSDRGLDLHGRYGFIPFDCTREWYMVSKSMEYAIADACVAKVARKFSDDKTAEEFEWRSKASKDILTPSQGSCAAAISRANSAPHSIRSAQNGMMPTMWKEMPGSTHSWCLTMCRV